MVVDTVVSELAVVLRLTKTQPFLQEKELAKAAGKLADCQKTIASLSSQLKSLADFDEFLPGTETGGAASADTWDGDLKLLHPASYPAQIGYLAVT